MSGKSVSQSWFDDDGMSRLIKLLVVVYPQTEGGIGDKARIDERIIQRIKIGFQVSPVDAPSRNLKDLIDDCSFTNFRLSCVGFFCGAKAGKRVGRARANAY